jgi:chemotaxis protein methyltransferase CheR
MGTKDECVELLQFALPRLGLRWKGFHGLHRQVCRKIARRVAELGLADLGDYRARLASDEREWRVLDALCAVTISRFYRDRGVFDALRTDLLPALASDAASRGERTLRAWSAGCASGEEPYTLAMAWRFDVGPRFPELALHIVASDTGEDVLARARDGVYGASSLRELPPEWRARAFDRAGAEGTFRIRPELRDAIELRREDVRAQMPEPPLHLVLCRNLAFTYFDETTQRAFVRRLAARMPRGGALIVGAHEALPVGIEGFAPDAAIAHAYRATGAER